MTPSLGVAATDGSINSTPGHDRPAEGPEATIIRILMEVPTRGRRTQASASKSSRGRSLRRVSSSSAAGSLSATIPEPAYR